MNQEPRIIFDFKKDRTEYRLVYDGANYALQARDVMYSPCVWQNTNYGFQVLCEYIEYTLLQQNNLTVLVQNDYITYLEEALEAAIDIGDISIPADITPYERTMAFGGGIGEDKDIVRQSDVEESHFFDSGCLANFIRDKINTGETKYQRWSW